MASQIAHIVYAKKYFEKSDLLPAEKEEFILGCAFPDIRRIDENIKRKDTHLRFELLDLNFENLTPFEAGWKFHLYCDMRREEILNSFDFYSQKYTGDFSNQPAKMLEDEILYSQYDNWDKLVNYFNNVPILATGIDVPQETFEFWYSLLANYLKEKPNSNSIFVFLLKQPGAAKNARKIAETVDKLRKNDKVVKILKKVKDEIV